MTGVPKARASLAGIYFYPGLVGDVELEGANGRILDGVSNSMVYCSAGWPAETNASVLGLVMTPPAGKLLGKFASTYVCQAGGVRGVVGGGPQHGDVGEGSEGGEGGGGEDGQCVDGVMIQYLLKFCDEDR